MASKRTAKAVAGLILSIAVCLCLQSQAFQSPRAGSVNLKRAGAKVSAPYYFDAWTTDNGLPQNSVSSILQTRDGYLWLTTNDGLVRYDGVRFTIFNAGNRKDLKTSRFSYLLEDNEASLWIFTEDTSLIRYKNGLFTAFTTKDGLPADQALRIRKDEEGALVLDTSLGSVRWEEGKFIPYSPGQGKPYSGQSFALDSGVVWYFEDSKLYRVRSGQVSDVIAMYGVGPRDIKYIYEDRKGETWIGTVGVVMRFKDGRLTRYTQKDGLPDKRVNCIRDDRRGNIWIGMADGWLVRLKDDTVTRYSTADGLTGDNVLTIYEDREGIVWIGTTSGLNRLRDNIITSYSTEDGLAANNTYPIYEDREGTIWIGSWRGLTRYRDGVFTSCGQQYDGMANALITSFMFDREGGFWIGTLGGGVNRFKDGKVTVYKTETGFPTSLVRAILEDREGSIWFCSPDGLIRYKNGALRVYTTKDGLPSDTVNTIYEDREGNLWIGTKSGLCRYRDGRFDDYSQEEDLSHTVRTIYEDGEGVIWIGTYDGGLIRRKDGRFTRYTTNEGLFNNGVFQILEDAGGNFWMSCNLGIYRVSRKELTDYAEGRISSITSIPYGKRDGMLNSECNGGAQPAGIKAADGRLWFPTQGGVAVVDPEAMPVIVQPPPVVIEEVLLNNHPVAFGETVDIEPGAENFEIHYTGLSFIMSERIRFKYIIEGLDRDWVDAGTRRVAYYSHAPPGSYTFKVIAANRDGVWNREGATVRIRIIPPFWRTWWFLSLAAAIFAGLVLLGFRLRITQLERARRAQEAFSEQLISSQESERKRIAAELHDSLGQHLLIIKNSALLALNSDNGKEQLGDISVIASQAIDEVREISYNLRPYQLDDIGLTKAIESIIAKVASSSEIEFAFESDRIDDLFTAEEEINIYRIVQESLNNIVKHSGARRATIRIERQGRRVEIMIRDDGRGFDSEQMITHERREGFGLKGISERARMLGAKYVINSAAGEGTVINLNLERENGRREK